MRQKIIRGIALASALFLGCNSGVAMARDIQLSLPVDCRVGTVCMIQNYVDRDPGSGVQDYSCGRLSYDGHKGTDFRLPDASWLDRGVRVLAAAPGKVLGVRNNVRDHAPGAYDRKKNKGRECGNGVVIDHGDGWQTQYCHMRLGSVRVRKGDQVNRHQALGLIGLTGKTEFPHLHMSLRLRGKVVDPFLGARAKPGCGVIGRPMWRPEALVDLAYRPSGILAAGFTDQTPKLRQVVSGRHRNDRLDRSADKLLFWVLIFGLQPGDEEVHSIIAPDGKVMARHQGRPAKEHKARWFSYSGKRARGAWPAGTYRGEYQLLRTTGGRKRVVLKTTAQVRVY